MGILSLLREKSRYFYVSLVFLGLSDSILNLGLLLFINIAVNGEALPPILAKAPAVVYAGILFVSIMSSNLFQRYIIRLTNDLRFEMELKILAKLKLSSYERFEKLGNEKVFTAMGDARELADVPEVLMNTFNAVVIVVCCLGYLFWTSLIGGSMILLIMAVLLVVYLYRNKQAERDINALRDLQDKYFIYLNDLLHGYKELRMSAGKTNKLFDNHFFPNRREGKKLATGIAIRYMSNELTGKYSWYIVLGVVIFGLPTLIGFRNVQLLAFISTILYLIGPVAVLVTLVPTITRVKVAVSRLNRFEQQMNTELDKEEVPATPATTIHPAERIRFEDVRYNYTDEDGNTAFSLGPLNLDIEKGKLMFVTGGNGSGKSTFVNLITGLYKPESGRVFLCMADGSEISSEEPHYRDHLSVIFTIPYLFNENYYDFTIDEKHAPFKHLSEIMQLDSVLRLDAKKGMADKNLSKGQQKRLAMIYSLLEAKSILILDEWAAEQDPEFRSYFYRKFLPGLIKDGKTVVAITHDDAYFKYADTVVKFDYGNISSTTEIDLVLNN